MQNARAYALVIPNRAWALHAYTCTFAYVYTCAYRKVSLMLSIHNSRMTAGTKMFSLEGHSDFLCVHAYVCVCTRQQHELSSTRAFCIPKRAWTFRVYTRAYTCACMHVYTSDFVCTHQQQHYLCRIRVVSIEASSAFPEE
jgi:hypothetical protein